MGKEKDKEKKSSEEKVKFCRLREDSQGKPHGKEKEKENKTREERAKCCRLQDK